MISTLYKRLAGWLAGLVLIVALALGSAYWGYNQGEEHQQAVYATAQAKANAEVQSKNEKTQAAADKQAEVQVVYKDRIVTQYKTITKDVIQYVQTPAAAVGLDPEFVRLHNNAASVNDALPIAESASGANGEAGPVGVTTGEAIDVITRNYEAYQLCRRQVIGWQDFYTDLQKTVNVTK